MNPAQLLLAAFVLLAGGLQFGGPELPFWTPLLFLVPSFGCVIAACRAAKNGVRSELSARSLALALAGLLAVTFKEFPGMYVEDSAYNARVFTWTGIFLAYALFRAATGGRYEKVERIGFWIALGGLVFLRAGMLFASPKPYIDVFSMIQQSMENLFQGRNPFLYPIQDIYNGSLASCYVMKAYSYPPANIPAHALAFWFGGDARWVTVVADLVTALLLFDIGRRVLDHGRGELLALLFLAQPRAFFTVEQAWTEPLVGSVFVLFLWLWTRGWKKTALAAYGYLISLKQYWAFPGALILILERRWTRLLIVVGVAVVTTVPFLLWDTSSVISEGFLMQLSACFRQGTPTMAAVFHAATGIVPPKLWIPVLGFGSAAFFPWWLRTLEPLPRYVLSTLCVFFALFLFGSQAFLNYYMLVGTVMLCGIATSREKSN
jgi:hypothetical protein